MTDDIKTQEPIPDYAPPERAIGGWLYLVAFGLFFSPIKQIAFIATYPELFEDGSWEYLTTPATEGYIPWFGTFLISEIVINCLFVLASFVLIFLFVKKKQALPIWYGSVALFSTIFLVVDTFVASLLFPEMDLIDNEVIRGFGSSFFSLFVWTPYLFYSKRSKETFIFK